MQQIKDYLAEGVDIHAYADTSGVVLFNDHSTQMLTIYMSMDELTLLCNKYFEKAPHLSTESQLTCDQLSLLKALQRQQFLQSH